MYSNRCRYTNEFMGTLMSNPELVRNVAIVGHLHHGKTTIMDMFVEQVRMGSRCWCAWGAGASMHGHVCALVDGVGACTKAASPTMAHAHEVGA